MHTRLKAAQGFISHNVGAHLQRATLVLAALCAAPALAADGDPRAQAREIYAATKISGGVVVYLGCAEPDLLAALRVNEHYLVQAFDRDPQRVAAARERLQQLGVYGAVSTQLLHDRLPYPDNSVNCIVAPSLHGLPAPELRRALCPGGVLYYRPQGHWSVEQKPYPAEMDGWPQFLHDAQNNAVSHDTRVSPSRSLQWVAAPRWARDHGQLGWVMVSAGGRLFSIEDEGPISYSALPSDWKLVCRDAFNGVVLWKQSLPDWFEHLYFRSGPNQLMRRLAAQDDALFTTLGLCAPVSVLDPASGRVLRTIADSANTAEIVCDSPQLFLLVKPDLAKYLDQYYLPRTTGLRELPQTRNQIRAVAAGSGATLWQKDDADTANVMELTLAADARQVYFLTNQNLVCLDRATGKTRWKTPRAATLNRPTWSAPTLMINAGLVFVGDRDPSRRASAVTLANGGAPCTIAAYAAHDGQLRWQCPAEDGFHFPVDVLAIKGHIWSGAASAKEKPGFVEIRNAQTGAVQITRKPDTEYAAYAAGHHRCHRNKATERYVITGRDGIQWIDVESGVLESDKFLRGNCGFGVMPANGLLYVPPNGCACNFYEKLPGTLALSGAAPTDVETTAVPQPVRGPAAGVAAVPTTSDSDAWPTYRHDCQRRAIATTTVPAAVKLLWRQAVGGRLSSLTSANARVYVASVDRHTLYALDAAQGRLAWTFTADARIDSPPTVSGANVYFGSCDGWIYALNASSGILVWKLQAAPAQRFIQSYGQLESSWPVGGSVLVREGFVYALAGRSPYLDGGVFLYKIDAATGAVVLRRHIAQTPAERGAQGEPFLPDLLSADSESLFIRQARFSSADLQPLARKAHLWSGIGFLDDTWFNRAYWMFADRLEMGNPHWFTQGNTTPAGMIMCCNDEHFYCFGKNVYGGHKRTDKAYNHLFAVPRPFQTLPLDKKEKFAAATKQFVIPDWAVPQEMDVLAMAGTARRLFIAGPLHKTQVSAASLAGKEGLALRAIDPANGSVLAETPLPALPVFDGLIAASGRLFVALKDGSVACFGP